MRYVRIRVRRLLSRSGLPDLDYAVNPYAGCAHACVYCYARSYTPYRDAAERWGEVVYVKMNAAEVLERELRSARRGVVGVSTITDPYQPIEAEEELTRRCLEVLAKRGFRVSVQTKSPLVTRDLDVMEARPELFDVGVTITIMDPDVARLIEPRAPPPAERARALEEIAERGIKTWVFLGPILPGVNDSRESIRRVVEVAQRTGSTLYYDFLRVRPALKGLRALGPRWRAIVAIARDSSWRRRVEEIVVSECRRLGVKCEPEFEESHLTTLEEFL